MVLLAPRLYSSGRSGPGRAEPGRRCSSCLATPWTTGVYPDRCSHEVNRRPALPCPPWAACSSHSPPRPATPRHARAHSLPEADEPPRRSSVFTLPTTSGGWDPLRATPPRRGHVKSRQTVADQLTGWSRAEPTGLNAAAPAVRLGRRVHSKVE